MYKHILLATDLTESCHVVVEKAKNLAKQHKAKLTIVHIIEPMPAFGRSGYSDVGTEGIAHAKDALVELAAKFSLKDADLHVEVGPAKHAITTYADKVKADLIVVGSHGYHGLARLLGGTANAVLHHANCDTLTVRMNE